MKFEFKIPNKINNKYIKILIYFLITMILLTFVSRLSKSLTVPVVQTVKIQSAEIKNTVSINGMVKGSENVTINSIEGCKVNNIFVSIGSQVNKGDILFQIDLGSISEKLLDIQNQIDVKSKALERANEDYNYAKKSEEQKINNARNAMIKAEGLPEYEELKNNYENLLSDKDYSLTSYKRAIEDLKQDNSLQTLESIKNNYNNIIKENGNITASCSGVVSEIFISNDTVSDVVSAMVITDISKGIRFEGNVSALEGEKIKIGMKATQNSGDLEYTIKSCVVDKKDSNMANVIATIDYDKDIEINFGKNITIDVVLSQEEYSDCIPFEALRADSNKYFILILKEENSFVGTIYKAERINVEIIDKNSRLIAIKNTEINLDDEIIIGSNKNVFTGDEVRKDNE